ncbi:hypothetical protein M407DRAFT_73961 [Tulasnella calospora MUT 4182]|uniref:CxC2-like cysteine cluster KDZ transposase-associated domain-containing protein n=1 Tax=Tulasnella calospora MUT 4182 TaxID=1051891 RepID=A0A0C3Q9W0_9AGAM|nr:hypothetical protein M407DRAFT_73961 [Tulasnella calospora MUT 4182]
MLHDFLHALYAIDGLNPCGESSTKCQKCNTSHANSWYRCLDCFGGHILCTGCIKATHFPYGDPFHRIEKLTATSSNEHLFTRAALSDPEIGGALYCGHGGMPCPFHSLPRSGLVRILDANGIFIYRVFQCSCASQHYPEGIPLPLQFFHMALFPATYDKVQTAFTFKALKIAQLHRFSGKESVWDFYAVVRRWTNNVDPRAVPDLYPQFRKASQLWGTIRLVKRSGHHDFTIPHGGLVVLCPTCPRPDINIPENWKNDPLA